MNNIDELRMTLRKEEDFGISFQIYINNKFLHGDLYPQNLKDDTGFCYLESQINESTRIEILDQNVIVQFFACLPVSYPFRNTPRVKSLINALERKRKIQSLIDKKIF